MNAAIQLALMTKAKTVFGDESTFLSFPVTPLPFTRQELGFAASNDLGDMEAFSSLVNLIPEGEAWLPTEAQYLWDVYDETLRTAELASAARTAEEEAEYRRSLCFLHVLQQDGTWEEDTEFLKAYRQHRDRKICAEEAYRVAQATAASSTDPAARQRWSEIDEPALRAAVTSAQQLWETDGYKGEVEAAQATVTRLGARSPSRTWAQWSGLCVRDVDALTSTSGFIWFPSGFSPENALDEGAWQTFTLSGDEIEGLVARAPAELRARLSADDSGAEVASCTFEFSSAAIQRPWFVPDLFRARFWRFTDPSRILSDGGNPPSGLCPAYVTAVVFARHVAVAAKTAAPRESPAAIADLRFPVAANAAANIARVHAGREHSFRRAPARRSSAPLEVSAPRRAMLARPELATLIAQPRMPASFATAAPGGRSVAAERSRALLRLRRQAIVRSSMLPKTAASEGAPAPGGEQDTIYVLAFICKRLPRCPDPDPSLQW